jgi:hypothetical protein
VISADHLVFVLDFPLKSVEILGVMRYESEQRLTRLEVMVIEVIYHVFVTSLFVLKVLCAVKRGVINADE